MSGFWRYKWVSAILRGEPDVDAARRAKARGWEPVPDGTAPYDLERPEGPKEAFVLYRMYESAAESMTAERAELNATLEDPAWHSAQANANIEAYKKELQGDSPDPVGTGWGPIEVRHKAVARGDELKNWTKRLYQN